MATSNKLRALNRLPYDFEDGLKVGGVDITYLSQLNTDIGSSLVGYDGGTVQDALNKAKPITRYSQLRLYAGTATQVHITDPGVEGYFYYDATDTTSADNDGTVIVGSDNRRWKRHYSGAVNVKWFGVAGDGVTNDTAKITALEAQYSGAHIDLHGKQYVVDTVPTGCRYYNGDFIVGTTRVSLRRNKLDNPMDGNSWMAIGDGLTHYWLFGFVYLEASGQLLAFVKPAYRHATSDSTPLNVIFSDDRGATWKDEKTIYSVSGYDISHAACTIMGSGRIGLVAYVKDLDAPAVFRDDFIYSDDLGVTWSWATNIAPAAPTFTYGDMMAYPAAAGGSDSAGFAVYGYCSTGTAVIYTVNNGSSWTVLPIAGLDVTYNPPPLYTPVPLFNEVSVVRVNMENKWIMFLRSGAGNLYVSTSTNMKTWTAPVDSGYALGSNPVYAIADGGRLFVYCFFRDYATGAAALENQLICFEEDPALVYAASNLVNKAPRAISDGPDRNVGYVCIRKVQQDFVWGYTVGERQYSTNQAAASTIVFGSTRRVPVAGPAYVQSVISNPNLFRNPTFQFWSRGTSFVGLTSNTKTADGWKHNSSLSTVTVSRYELTPEESILFPFNPRYAYSIVSTVGSDYIGLDQSFFGKEELLRFSEQKVTVQIWGIGDIPGTVSPTVPRVVTTFNYGVGGSATVTTIKEVRITESAGNVWKATVTVDCPTVLGKTIGTNPYVFISFDSQANGAWNAKIVGMKAEFGQYASRFDPVDYQADRAACNRYVQRIDLVTYDALCTVAGVNTTTAYGVISYPEMIKTPSPSFVLGAATDLEIYPDLIQLSDIVFSNAGSRAIAATVTIPTADIVKAGAYGVRAKNGVSVAILLDAE